MVVPSTHVQGKEEIHAKKKIADESQTKNEVKEKKKLGRGKGFRIHGLGKRNWEGAGGKDHIRRRIGDDVA